MPWLRLGDTAANHPIALAVLEDPAVDDRLLNEVFGFVVRCALQSTAHLTDYLISRGTAIQIGGASRAYQLLDAAIDAGYLAPAKMTVDGIERDAYKLLDDPDFIHMRTREEIEWERQRKSDNSNPALIVPVRLRDGDACRYCGMVVDFRPGQRRGRIAGTYDHRRPGQAATIETYVVACSGCNATRGDNPNADAALPLLPEPTKPYYSEHTVAWIRDNEWAKRNGIKTPRRSAKIAPGKPARKSAATPANGSTSGPAPELNSSTGDTLEQVATPANGSTSGPAPGTEPIPTGDELGSRKHDLANLPTKNEEQENLEPKSSGLEKQGLTCENVISDRNPQIPQNGSLPDLETPGRVGSGRVGSVAGTATATHQTTHTTARERPRKRKGRH